MSRRTPTPGSARAEFRLRVGDSDLGVVADAAALVPRVAVLGGVVTGGPDDMPRGQRVLHVRDPDGNAVNPAQLGCPFPSVLSRLRGGDRTICS